MIKHLFVYEFAGFAPSDKDMRLAEDGKPFTTLLYANGPGYKYNISNGECPHDREDLTDVNISKFDSLQILKQTAVLIAAEKLEATFSSWCYITSIITN